MLETPASETMLHRGLECSKSRIVLEDKVAVLIPNLFVSYDVSGRILRQSNVCMGRNNFIRLCVDISLRSSFIVDFKGFRFSKVNKTFKVKKVK